MEIKFSKPFNKLLNETNNDFIQSATLIAVFKIADKSYLSESFLDYDTDGNYEIEEQKPLLMLLFKKPSNNNAKNIFATIRIWTEEKETLYRNKIGNEFKVVIER